MRSEFSFAQSHNQIGFLSFVLSCVVHVKLLTLSMSSCSTVKGGMNSMIDLLNRLEKRT